MATSFNGGRSRSTRREPPTMGKQLVNFITYGCESSATVENSGVLIDLFAFFIENKIKRNLL
jgi:hypothetical protein